MNKVKIRDITFRELEEYVKKNCPFSGGVMRIEIMGKNAGGWECITGLPTNDSRSVILQGASTSVLEQELKVEFKTKEFEIQQLKNEIATWKKELAVYKKGIGKFFNIQLLGNAKLEQNFECELLKNARKELEDEK